MEQSYGGFDTGHITEAELGGGAERDSTGGRGSRESMDAQELEIQRLRDDKCE